MVLLRHLATEGSHELWSGSVVSVPVVVKDDQRAGCYHHADGSERYPMMANSSWRTTGPGQSAFDVVAPAYSKQLTHRSPRARTPPKIWHREKGQAPQALVNEICPQMVVHVRNVSTRFFGELSMSCHHPDTQEGKRNTSNKKSALRREPRARRREAIAPPRHQTPHSDTFLRNAWARTELLRGTPTIQR